MEKRTLVLTSWYMPVQIVNWKDAITDLFLGKTESVVDYSDEIRSPSTVMKLPAVVRIKRQTGAIKHRVKYSKMNMVARDNGRCQYCLGKFPMSQLTQDHVFPKSRGGETTWENVVMACRHCNSTKGDRTPQEAGMVLHTVPRKPGSLPVGPLRVQGDQIPEQWAAFVTA